MASRIADNRTIKHNRIRAMYASVTILVISVITLIFIGFPMLDYPLTGIVAKCYGCVSDELQALVTLLCLGTLFLIAGLVHDIKMARFLKKRRAAVGPGKSL